MMRVYIRRKSTILQINEQATISCSTPESRGGNNTTPVSIRGAEVAALDVKRPSKVLFIRKVTFGKFRRAD